jgi:hypothetical protein
VNDKVASGTVDSQPAQNRRRLFRRLLVLAGLGITGVLLSQEKPGPLPEVHAVSTVNLDSDNPGANSTGIHSAVSTANTGGVFFAKNTGSTSQGLVGIAEDLSIPNDAAIGVQGLALLGTGVQGISYTGNGATGTSSNGGFGVVGNSPAGRTFGTVSFALPGIGVKGLGANVGVDGAFYPGGSPASSGPFALGPPFVGVRGTSDTSTAKSIGVLGAAGSPVGVPIVAHGANGQSANLQEWQMNDGTALSVVDKNGNFGVGTATPQSRMYVVDSTTNPTRGIIASQNNDGRQAALMQMTKSRGTEASPTAVVNGDYVAAFNMNAYDGTSYLGGKPMAGWGARVNGAVATGSVPTDLFFYTKPSGTLDPYGDGVVRFIIASNGNIYANGALLSASDLRLKTDIEPIDNALDKVLALNGVYFHWKEDAHQPDGRQVGVIAQNVQQVLPEIVSTSPATNGYLSVDYTRLVPVLIQAMKEQQEQFKNENEKLQARLQDENEELQGRIAILERKVNQFAS